jgi:hypothetical protein
MATVPKISPRAKAINWLNQHNELLEQPPGSNKDSRDDGISAAQRRLADWLVGRGASICGRGAWPRWR